MNPAMVTATWQAVVLSAISNVLGQFIKCYQTNKPFSINATDVAHFVLFSLLATPPNFMWQSWLEKHFPGYAKDEGRSKKTDEKSAPANPNSSSLNITNTAIKFLLDQTVGAWVNTLLFIAGLGLMRGQPTDVIVAACREKFWPLIVAGMKLWPAVSILNFTLVPVQYRLVVGSIVGLFWGIYLSLMSGSSH